MFYSSFIPSDILQFESHALSRVFQFISQFDFRDGVASQTTWLANLPWEGMAAFKAATRHVWYRKDGIVAGYVTQSTNLTRLVLTNAAMSPGFVIENSRLMVRDSPEAALTMMENFVEERAFNISR